MSLLRPIRKFMISLILIGSCILIIGVIPINSKPLDDEGAVESSTPGTPKASSGTGEEDKKVEKSETDEKARGIDAEKTEQPKESQAKNEDPAKDDKSGSAPSQAETANSEKSPKIKIPKLKGRKIESSANETADGPKSGKDKDESDPIIKLKSAVTSSVHIDEITISGISAGGTFAQILHLSHSNLFSGIGIFAAWFYKCGGSSKNLEEHYAKCGNMGGFNSTGYEPNPKLASPKTAIEQLVTYEENDLVDRLENLATQKVFLWIATLDQWIPISNAAAAVDIYEPYLDTKQQIKSVLMSSTHHFPTLHTGAPCSKLSTESPDPMIGACGYNGAFEMLNFLISKPNSGFVLKEAKHNIKLNRIQEFDQTEFFKDIKAPTGLDSSGFIYVPTRCQQVYEHCHLHFYFHGCRIGKDDVETDHIIKSGLLEVAERNGIVIVFPQVKKTPENPYTCWDFFGYNGEDFANKNGTQVRAIRRMVTQFFPKGHHRKAMEKQKVNLSMPKEA